MRRLACLLAAAVLLLASSAARAVTRCEVLARAQKWVAAQVPYSWNAWYTDPTTGVCCYRSDCSGFVSAVWGRPAPGNTTYSFAGGPWDDGSTYVIAASDLQPGDALNHPGDPNAGTGHVMLYVSGDFKSGWVEVYEEYGHGHPAVHRWRSIDPSIYLPIRYKNIEPCEDCNAACGHYGCQCVDGQCSGGFCPGTGCTAKETQDCGNFGCNCVDHQCNGGYCAGSGCTAKEINDCSKFGCQCVDHQCSGGYCPDTGCTAKEINDCSKFACDCVDHQCSGGYGCGSKGTGCTAKETTDCQKSGCNCYDHKCTGGSCSPPPSGSAGASAGGATGDAAVQPPGDQTDAGASGAAGAPWSPGRHARGAGGAGDADAGPLPSRGEAIPGDGTGCSLAGRPARRPTAAMLLLGVAAFVRRRRKTRRLRKES